MRGPGKTRHFRLCTAVVVCSKAVLFFPVFCTAVLNLDHVLELQCARTCVCVCWLWAYLQEAFKDFKAGEQQFGSRGLRSWHYFSSFKATWQDIRGGSRRRPSAWGGLQPECRLLAANTPPRSETLLITHVLRGGGGGWLHVCLETHDSNHPTTHTAIQPASQPLCCECVLESFWHSFWPELGWLGAGVNDTVLTSWRPGAGGGRPKQTTGGKEHRFGRNQIKHSKTLRATQDSSAG